MPGRGRRIVDHRDIQNRRAAGSDRRFERRKKLIGCADPHPFRAIGPRDVRVTGAVDGRFGASPGMSCRRSARNAPSAAPRWCRRRCCSSPARRWRGPVRPRWRASRDSGQKPPSPTRLITTRSGAASLAPMAGRWGQSPSWRNRPASGSSRGVRMSNCWLTPFLFQPTSVVMIASGGRALRVSARMRSGIIGKAGAFGHLAVFLPECGAELRDLGPCPCMLQPVRDASRAQPGSAP